MEYLQQLINGISLGSVYALIALGYTMVYGIIKLINFAHGDIYMLGAFIGFFAAGALKIPFIPALIIAMVGSALVGVVIEKLAYLPIRNAPRIAALITAIGVSLFLENVGLLVLRPEPRAYPKDILPLDTYQIGDLLINNRQLVMLGVAIGLMLLLQYIVHCTKIGKAMRAVSYDKEAAKLMGIDVDMVISATFAIGSALAGAAGVLVGIYYNRIDPLMGIMPGLKAFVAAVLGGIGVIPGAMIGGIVMGIAEVTVVTFLASTWKDAVAFLILIVILLIKPSGLFSRNSTTKV